MSAAIIGVVLVFLAFLLMILNFKLSKSGIGEGKVIDKIFISAHQEMAYRGAYPIGIIGIMDNIQEPISLIDIPDRYLLQISFAGVTKEIEVTERLYRKTEIGRDIPVRYIHFGLGGYSIQGVSDAEGGDL